MPDRYTHRRGDDADDFVHERRAPEGATERWVKWAAGVALILASAGFSFVMDSRVRLTRLETTQEIFARDRMELDRQMATLLQRITDQHQVMIESQTRMLDELNRLNGTRRGAFDGGTRMFDK